jgi:hypothetical protein
VETALNFRIIDAKSSGLHARKANSRSESTAYDARFTRLRGRIDCTRLGYASPIHEFPADDFRLHRRRVLPAGAISGIGRRRGGRVQNRRQRDQSHER